MKVNPYDRKLYYTLQRLKPIYDRFLKYGWTQLRADEKILFIKAIRDNQLLRKILQNNLGEKNGILHSKD